MTNPTPEAQQIDPAILARLQALNERSTKALANLPATQQATQGVEQVTLTAMERLEQMRGRLHQQEQDTTREWENIRNQMPLDDATVEQDRGITD